MCSCAPSEGQGPRPPTMVRMTSADRRLGRVNPAAPYIRSMGIPRTRGQSRTPDFPRLVSSRAPLNCRRRGSLWSEGITLRGGSLDLEWPMYRTLCLSSYLFARINVSVISDSGSFLSVHLFLYFAEDDYFKHNFQKRAASPIER